jgi:hypothetical protein
MTYCPLDLVENYLRRFIAYPSEHALVAHALWIAHTHMLESFDTTPRLVFMSEEKESGKTRALEATAELVPYPILSISASPAVIVRRIAQGQCTLLYDEIDGVFGNIKAQEANLDLRSVLNGGYRRGAKVHRCVIHGKKVEIEELDAFAPVAVAGLRSLPDTLASRAIMIRMKRRAPDEQVEPFRCRYHSTEAKPIREALAEWCSGNYLGGIEPDMPRGIEDRAADCWEPLLAIADAAGSDWPTRARAAAVFLTNRAADETLTAGVELLAHIRDAFGDEPYLATTALLDRLRDRDESPWRDIRGRPLDDRGLARRLKGYGIRSKTVRVDGKTPKGYDAADFADAWKRYLPPLTDVRHKGNSRHIFDNKNNFVAGVAVVAAGDQEDAFEERAAILQFDGGLSREEAEARAAEELDIDLTLPAFLDRRRGTHERRPLFGSVNLPADSPPLPLERFERLKELREQYPIRCSVEAVGLELGYQRPLFGDVCFDECNVCCYSLQLLFEHPPIGHRSEVITSPPPPLRRLALLHPV